MKPIVNTAIVMLVIVMALVAIILTIISNNRVLVVASKKGFKDGQNSNFDQTSQHSSVFINCYERGFNQGCLSVKGNLKEAIEQLNLAK